MHNERMGVVRNVIDLFTVFSNFFMDQQWKSVETTEKSALKLGKLPNLKVIGL